METCSSSHSPGRARTISRRRRRSPRYSLFTLSKIKDLASQPKAHEANRGFTRSYAPRPFLNQAALGATRVAPAAVDTNDALRHSVVAVALTTLRRRRKVVEVN